MKDGPSFHVGLGGTWRGLGGEGARGRVAGGRLGGLRSAGRSALGGAAGGGGGVSGGGGGGGRRAPAGAMRLRRWPRAAVFARRGGVGGVDKEPCVERGGGPDSGRAE